MENKITFNCAIDRIEGEYAIIIPEDSTTPVEIPAELVHDAVEGKRYAVSFCDGAVCKIEPLEDTDNKARLQKLFNKNKNK